MSALTSCDWQMSGPGVGEVQSQVLEELHSLNFVKEGNSTTFLERKLSFEKKKLAPLQVCNITVTART